MREIKANDMRQIEAAQSRHHELLYVAESNHAETKDALTAMGSKMDSIVLSLSPAPGSQSPWAPPRTPSQGGAAGWWITQAVDGGRSD